MAPARQYVQKPLKVDAEQYFARSTIRRSPASCKRYLPYDPFPDGRPHAHVESTGVLGGCTYTDLLVLGNHYHPEWLLRTSSRSRNSRIGSASSRRPREGEP